MRYVCFSLLAVVLFNHSIMGQKKLLTRGERHVVLDKGTEAPFSGVFLEFDLDGTYVCKQCGAALYRSADKFHAGCGWPSFDDEVKGAVARVADGDGQRVEILCVRCGAHLGHVFEGEGFTGKGVRHCVNSASLDFVPAPGVGLETAVFAGGCFWGLEYYMRRIPGVLAVESGYTGGHVADPLYEEVCSGRTGHFEAVRVFFDAARTDYESVARCFFELHDPTQADGQGPDVGEQYRSAIFYASPAQEEVARALIARLRAGGCPAVTAVLPATVFWRAEDRHQGYYDRTGKLPYCHAYTRRF
jgi:peptide methionine sulfoxide reductase msrA/msrB